MKKYKKKYIKPTCYCLECGKIRPIYNWNKTQPSKHIKKLIGMCPVCGGKLCRVLFT